MDSYWETLSVISEEILKYNRHYKNDVTKTKEIHECLKETISHSHTRGVLTNTHNYPDEFDWDAILKISINLRSCIHCNKTTEYVIMGLFHENITTGLGSDVIRIIYNYTRFIELQFRCHYGLRKKMKDTTGTIQCRRKFDNILHIKHSYPHLDMARLVNHLTINKERHKNIFDAFVVTRLSNRLITDLIINFRIWYLQDRLELWLTTYMSKHFSYGFNDDHKYNSVVNIFPNDGDDDDDDDDDEGDDIDDNDIVVDYNPYDDDDGDDDDDDEDDDIDDKDIIVDYIPSTGNDDYDDDDDDIYDENTMMPCKKKRKFN